LHNIATTFTNKYEEMTSNLLSSPHPRVRARAKRKIERRTTFDLRNIAC